MEIKQFSYEKFCTNRGETEVPGHSEMDYAWVRYMHTVTSETNRIIHVHVCVSVVIAGFHMTSLEFKLQNY